MIYLTPLLYAYLLWLLFLAVMALQWKWKALSKTIKVIAIPAVLLAVLLDFTFNVTIGTVMFLELPSTWTFSQRIGAYKKRADWREPIATWICGNLLDVFDITGSHCR